MDWGARLIESLTGLTYIPSLFIFAVSVLVYVIIGGFRAVALSRHCSRDDYVNRNHHFTGRNPYCWWRYV